MTQDRRTEVQALLRITARHLSAKEKGENSQMGFGHIRPLDSEGNATGEWKSIGPIQFIIDTQVDVEVIDILLRNDNG